MITMFQFRHPHQLIPDINDGYGVAFRDMNGDELPDIYLVRFRSLNRLLINRGAEQLFRDATIESGLGGNLMPMGILNLELGTTVIDLDNDGDGDVSIAGWGVTTSLYRNEGKCHFNDITRQLEYRSPLDGNAAIGADVNLDGLLDLFFTDEHYTNRLFLNQTNGRLKDVTETSGLAYSAKSQGASFSDVDLDGDLDLYVTNWYEPDLLYRNTGKGLFRRVLLPITVCTDSISTNSVSFGDIDNDGDFDFFVTNREGGNFLYRNETSPQDTNWIFTDITQEVNLTAKGVSYGSIIGDFDHDGWQDIFITNIGANRFYLNQGDGTFKKTYEDPVSINSGKFGYSTGVAYADYDGDGDLDLFVANKDTFSQIYINPINDKQYIKLRIEGIKSNRDAIGTRVEFYSPGYIDDRTHLLGTREISGGSGYLSLNEPMVHFGLDTLTRVDVKIIFPSGKTLAERNIKAGTTYHIAEYRGISKITIITLHHLLRLVQQSKFWIQTICILFFLFLTLLLVCLGLKRYHWNAATASGYIAGFFLMALVIMVVLKAWVLHHQFFAIDLLTAIFVLIFILNSERLSRLSQFRKKYHAILIQLGKKIGRIHDDRQLCETVIKNIHKHTEFTSCCVLLYNQEKQRFTECVCQGLKVTAKELNEKIGKKELSQLIRESGRGIKKSSKKLSSLFQFFNAKIIFSIERKEQYYGWLILGSDQNISPFTEDDISLFNTITNQMAITLENNVYIRQSNEMIKKLTAAEVREQYLKELEKTNEILDGKNHQLQKLYDELKSTESQLIHSEKMASLGQLVAGIAHELNNPIGFIYSNIKQMKRYAIKIEDFMNHLNRSGQIDEKPSSIQFKDIQTMLPDIKNLIDDTIKGSQMVKKLVDNLRQFSHLDQADWKSVDIHEGIENCLMILKPELKDRIQIHKDFQLKHPVECNIGQLNQVFLNLLLNAAQAIEKQGNLWIRTTENSQHIVIEIQDDGHGIPREIQHKIFDPFFTTKEVGQGIGLGLSISYSIIKNHGGSIEVESKAGKGSYFRVKIPKSVKPGK